MRRNQIKAGRKDRCRERGSSLIEFLFCTSYIILPLIMGTTVVGLNLIREIQVTELCRDAAHMYSYGIDFSQAANQSQLLKIAKGLNITSNGGNGVIILSTITYVDSTACTRGGYSSSNCTNLNQTVFTNRVVMGNSGLRVSSFGTPPTADMDSRGNLSQTAYLTDSGARATNFSSVISVTAGQYAYVAETYFKNSDLSWWGFLGTTGVSARFVF